MFPVTMLVQPLLIQYPDLSQWRKFRQKSFLPLILFIPCSKRSYNSHHQGLRQVREISASVQSGLSLSGRRLLPR